MIDVNSLVDVIKTGWIFVFIVSDKLNWKCDKLTDINKLKEDFQHLKGSLVKNTVFQNMYEEFVIQNIT